MPFRTLQDLPESVKEHLPKHGEEIYLAAFNSAYQQYDEPSERKQGRSREETAHAVAWAAVGKVYEKNQEGEWVKKASEK